MSEPTLHRKHHKLANAAAQLQIIQHGGQGDFTLTPFQQKLEESGLFPFRPAPTGMEVLQINLGKMCNQTCHHCHVDAGPDRKEIMTRQTLALCLDVLKTNPSFKTVDLTGGAPEMNPHFRWFVEQLSGLKRHVIVRCNLTIILANKKYHDLPLFYKKHGVEVISSLPCYTAAATDQQRGDGVFAKSIRALQLLNEADYGHPDSGLILNLVYNPSGAFLPPAQADLEATYKKQLRAAFGISFNKLLAITNMPISRYLEYLLTSGAYETYMEKLRQAYNPQAAAKAMCRHTVSVGWDGFLYDCDFNQMLELKVACNSRHLSEFNAAALQERKIIVGQHCYGCTAGAGSGCGGAVA